MNFGHKKKIWRKRWRKLISFLRLKALLKNKKRVRFSINFFLKVRCSAKTKRERRREKYGRQLRMTCFGVWLNYFDVKKIYSFPSSVQSMYINIIRGYYYGNFLITWQYLLKPWKRKKKTKQIQKKSRRISISAWRWQAFGEMLDYHNISSHFGQ